MYGGDRRRVPGLRRYEVALLAGISPRVHDQARARQRHRRLRERDRRPRPRPAARRGRAGPPARPAPHRRHHPPAAPPAGPTARPAHRAARPRLDDAARPRSCSTAASTSWPPTTSGVALFSPVYADPARPANNARFVFLDPQATEFFRDWDKVANDTVALLRAEAGRDPYDRDLSDLIGELSTRSEEFRRRWAAHNVRIHTTGIKLLHHPVVGDLDLPFESFPLAADPSQSLLTYTAEPGSPSQDALNLLASWAATTDNIGVARSTRDAVPGVPSPKVD